MVQCEALVLHPSRYTVYRFSGSNVHMVNKRQNLQKL